MRHVKRVEEEGERKAYIINGTNLLHMELNISSEIIDILSGEMTFSISFIAIPSAFAPPFSGDGLQHPVP